MPHLVSGKEFRTSMHRKYAEEFALHRAVAELLESALATPRPLKSVVAVAVDMLMTQGYKSHYAVRLMAERAQAEDAALLTRRLMELAVQAAYIIGDGAPDTAVNRAGMYLANLWRAAPDEMKGILPPEAAKKWTSIAGQYGPMLPKRGWAPSFRSLFVAIGQLEAYEQDYRFLSSIAHGSTEEAILHYSRPTVTVRSDLHVPTLLVYASRYYLALAHVWEEQFRLVDQDRYTQTVEPLLQALLDPPPGADAG